MGSFGRVAVSFQLPLVVIRFKSVLGFGLGSLIELLVVRLEESSTDVQLEV